MTQESAAQEYENLPLPAIDASLLDEYRRLMIDVALEMKVGGEASPTRSTDAAKRPLRAEHEQFVAKCIAEMTDANVHEIRARLRSANAALEQAEKHLDDQRTQEEIEQDESAVLRSMSCFTEVSSFVRRFWEQTTQRDPDVAQRWKRWYLSAFGREDALPERGDGFAIGCMILSRALSR